MVRQNQQSKSEGGKKTQISNKGGTKATTASNGDDDCANMPPLEDMRKTDATAGQKGKHEQGAKGAKEGKENVKLPEPRWSQGEASRRVSFPKKDVRDAYRLLELETSLSNEKLFWILDKKSNGMVSSFLSVGSPLPFPTDGFFEYSLSATNQCTAICLH